MFIGDSVTDRVELELIKAEWQRLQRAITPAVDKFIDLQLQPVDLVLDVRNSTSGSAKLKLDLFVLTFTTAMGLADSQALDVGNLALFFTDADDRPSLFEHDLRTFRQRADYLLSSVSLAFAMRDRIRDSHAEPHSTVPASLPETTNEFNFQYEQEHAPIAVDATPTYDALGVSSRGRARRASRSASWHSGDEA